MEYLYIKCKEPAAIRPASANKTNSLVKKWIDGLVSSFVPKANPDYDGLIDDVAEWLLEINVDDHKPCREIGIDQYGQTLMIMPWKDNYGYWTDNNITLDYFKEQFQAVSIDKVEFEKLWDRFMEVNPLSK